MIYDSPSECWRLAFARKKEYGVDERNAEYYLQLTVLFLGRSKAAPGNLATGVVRELPERDQG